MLTVDYGHAVDDLVDPLHDAVHEPRQEHFFHLLRQRVVEVPVFFKAIENLPGAKKKTEKKKTVSHAGLIDQIDHDLDQLDPSLPMTRDVVKEIFPRFVRVIRPLPPPCGNLS